MKKKHLIAAVALASVTTAMQAKIVPVVTANYADGPTLL